MLDNAYLYGEGVEVPELDTHMIIRRIELLEEHRAALYNVHYMDREYEKISNIEKAITFWTKLSRVN